jgi:hypothetical protein
VTATSQNGWPALTSTAGTSTFAAGGVSFRAANPDVAVCAGELISRYVAEVETIKGPVQDDWSWAERVIRGSESGTITNHASMTAWDLNALKYPQGTGNMPDAKIALVHRILATIVTPDGRRVFRWGGDYVHAKLDQMHYEIVVSKQDVADAAELIRKRHAEMDLTDTIILSPAAAAALGTPHKAGDKVTVQWVLMWGGARGKANAEQLEQLREQVRLLSATVTELQHATAQLVSRLPAKS